MNWEYEFSLWTWHSEKLQFNFYLYTFILKFCEVFRRRWRISLVANFFQWNLKHIVFLNYRFKVTHIGGIALDGSSSGMHWIKIAISSCTLCKQEKDFLRPSLIVKLYDKQNSLTVFTPDWSAECRFEESESLCRDKTITYVLLMWITTRVSATSFTNTHKRDNNINLCSAG